MRIIGLSFLVMLVIFLVLCTVNEVGERILVHWAKALLSDMHSLHLRQSNWNDAQRLMTRWGRWGHYDGTCTSQDCMYVITLRSRTASLTDPARWSSRITLFLSPFRLLPRQWGGGLLSMQTMFLVQDGLIVRSGIQVETLQSSFAKGACCGSAALIMSVHSKASLGAPEPGEEEQRSRHPDYLTWRPGGCTFCLMGRVAYADNVSTEEAARLSDFQLSCATRWSPCTTLEELDPAARAWHLYTDPPANTIAPPTPVGCALPAYSLGRDTNRILSVEALEDGINLGLDADGIEHERSRVRVLAALKGDSPWPVGSIHEIRSVESYFNDVKRRPAHLVKAKKYLLMLNRYWSEAEDQSPLTSCGVIEVDPVSVREVMRGMAMDDQLKGPEPYLNGFVGEFARRPPSP